MTATIPYPIQLAIRLTMLLLLFGMSSYGWGVTPEAEAVAISKDFQTANMAIHAQEHQLRDAYEVRLAAPGMTPVRKAEIKAELAQKIVDFEARSDSAIAPIVLRAVVLRNSTLPNLAPTLEDESIGKLLQVGHRASVPRFVPYFAELSERIRKGK